MSAGFAEPASTRSRRTCVDFRDTIRQIVARAGLRRGPPRSTSTGEYPLGHPRAVRRARPPRAAVRRGVRRHRHRDADAADRGRGGRQGLRLQSALILMVQELGTLPIQLFGSEELKQRFLPKCAAGEWSPAFALSEPEAGSDPGAMRTTAVRDGDEWVINGDQELDHQRRRSPTSTSSSPSPTARTRRITAFVVEADRPGFSVGKLEHKLGIKGSPTGSPVFDGRARPARERDRRGRQRDAGRARRRSSAPGSAPPPRPSASPRARPTTPTTTPRSGSPSASRSTSCRGSSSSSPTWRPAPPPPASSSTRPARWPTADEPGLAQVLLDGQALRLRQRDAGDGRGGPGPRRLRLRQGVPAGAA